ncbi:MAG TPA: hypothetical protein VGA97_07700 [Acidimicrobiia bacterium]
MAQEPNVELTESDRPRRSLEPAPATGWRSSKPGLPKTPEDVPRGGGYGMPGPDPGWAWRVVSAARLPDDHPGLRAVVTGLVMARAAGLGRAAVPEDVEAALVLCGFGEEATSEALARRRRWLAAVPHESRPGATAVAEVDRALLTEKPERIRWALRHGDKG